MNIKNLAKKFNYYQNAVYFSSANHQHRYFGFGKSDEIISNDVEEINNWQIKQTVPVFGGIPFDKQHLDSNLMNGYFIAPQYVIDEKTGQSWGKIPQVDSQIQTNHLNKIISSINDVNWIARTTSPLQEMLNDQKKKKVVLGMQKTINLDYPLNLDKLIISLNKHQPNSYHLIIKNNDEVFVSATPERLIRLNKSTIETAAVAGTTNRDLNPKIDQQLANDLKHDIKNLHEHELVVQEITNKIANLAKLDYPDEPKILKTPQVQHLYTPITGVLKQQTNLLQLVAALHPTPALGGIPLDWALSQIKNTELNPRGLFAAPIGYVLPNGDGEFVIGIRSLWEKQRTVKLFAGAGILAGSNLTQEAREIKLKMSVMEDLIKEQLHE
ncbi:isochorismate synthase [Fructilactobacillus lindneri]|uniref:isochorismate synthase n=2 Tax=Fructilactobacillus lindneri TaxID=53444 RepID=A0A0R2JRD3_9LACO|nr:isochorismate synthase [Fructilactobacillus lindneri]KRN79682.1 isochorismate synthase [Fructilactobacillus lindneri DSM 20690 = JCM 11027]